MKKGFNDGISDLGRAQFCGVLMGVGSDVLFECPSASSNRKGLICHRFKHENLICHSGHFLS
jgi:hypothetical protein